MITSPYALYINCDGAMDYNSKNHGGIGYVITFPDSVGMEPITDSQGIYIGANIERMEMEALIKAMEAVIDLYKTYRDELKNVAPIFFITDRYGLSDSERTNPYQIKEWRHNNWKNHEGKPIKNHELIDKLDKTRRKLAELSYKRVHIEYRPRKQNKAADKLAKAGKKEGLINTSISKVSEKIGKRKFDGGEIMYKMFSKNQELHINVFRKEPVQNLWEVNAEICSGNHQGQKLKIYVDDLLAPKLQRGNQYLIKLKEVHTYHCRIFRTIKKIKKAK